MKKKILYFEGAGCVPCNNVDNCRIRTAFTNKDGKRNTPEEYNYGDLFSYDAELTHRRRKKVEEMKKKFCVLFNQKYDNTSYYVENNQLVVCINVEEKKRIEAGYIERKFIVEV